MSPKSYRGYHEIIFVSTKISNSVLEFYTIYVGYELSRNRVVVPARQATQPGGIGSLEGINSWAP
jgi:hypothetical protein